MCGYVSRQPSMNSPQRSERTLTVERDGPRPSIDQRNSADVIDVYGEQLLDVAVQQSVAEIPANRQQDHVGREPVAGERRRCRTATTNHAGTLGLAPVPSTQQCPARHHPLLRPSGAGVDQAALR